MAHFEYKAYTVDGRLQTGVLTAPDICEANGLVSAMNLTPVDLAVKGASTGMFDLPGLKSRYGSVPARDLVLFTKQLVTMIRVGIPITQAMETLVDQTEHPRLRRLAGLIGKDIEDGSSLSAAMGKHPQVFSRLYCSIVEAGELGGTLPAVLDRLIYLIEHEAMIKAEIRNAIRYPIMVVAALVVAFVVMLGFVIPRFVTFFANANLDLPLPTRLCIAMSQFLGQNAIVLVLGSLALGFGLYHFTKTEKGKYLRDYALLRIPYIGPVLIKAAMSRFASIFALLQTSGVLVLEALRILGQTVGNEAIAAQFAQIRDSLEEGHGIAEPLRSAHYFPPMMINMVAIGEESGRLDEMLREISAHYDIEVRHAMKRMSDAIGPILIVGLAFVVGFFALAIYMPMWDLTQLAASRVK